MTKKEREEAKKARELQRNASMSDARTRQARFDVEVYGEGSMLLSAQKSSAGGDSRGGIWDVSTDNYKQEDRNESGQNSNINDDGIDALGRGAEVRDERGGDDGGNENPGLLVYRADGTQEFFAASDILIDYDAGADDNWSLEFEVSSSALVAFSTTEPVGTTSTERYDNDASADPPDVQTYYRIPVIRTITVGGDAIKFQWDISGIYRENIFCDGAKGATVELTRIG
jgi:hypothetical protein